MPHLLPVFYTKKEGYTDLIEWHGTPVSVEDLDTLRNPDTVDIGGCRVHALFFRGDYGYVQVWDCVNGMRRRSSTMTMEELIVRINHIRSQ